MEKIEALSLFLDALDEWGCDLSAYKDGPRLTVIKGGKEARDGTE